MSQRRTVTLSEDLVQKLEQFASEWQVSESEAMRRVFALGGYLATEIQKGYTIVKKDNKGGLIELHFPTLFT
jgi:hypothetical protein